MLTCPTGFKLTSRVVFHRLIEFWLKAISEDLQDFQISCCPMWSSLADCYFDDDNAIICFFKGILILQSLVSCFCRCLFHGEWHWFCDKWLHPMQCHWSTKKLYPPLMQPAVPWLCCHSSFLSCLLPVLLHAWIECSDWLCFFLFVSINDFIWPKKNKQIFAYILVHLKLWFSNACHPVNQRILVCGVFGQPGKPSANELKVGPIASYHGSLSDMLWSLNLILYTCVSWDKEGSPI